MEGLVYDPEELERCGIVKNLHCVIRGKHCNQHDGLIGVKKVDFPGHKLLFTVHEANERVV